MLVLLFPIQKTRFGGANAYYNYSAIGGPISYLSKSYSRKCFGSGLESILPADFIVVVIKEDGEVPIIMGRLFLAISWTIIDVKRGTIIIWVYDEFMD